MPSCCALFHPPHLYPAPPCPQVCTIERVREVPHEGPFCDMVWSDPEEIETWAISPRGAGWLFGHQVVEEFNRLNGLQVWAAMRSALDSRPNTRLAATLHLMSPGADARLVGIPLADHLPGAPARAGGAQVHV